MSDCEPQIEGELATTAPDEDNSVPKTSSEKTNIQFQKPQTSTKRKRAINNNSAEVTNHLKAASAALQNLTNRSRQFQQDAAGLFGLLLAEKLRKLPITTRLVLQNKIDNLVFEAEYNENVTAVMSSNSSSASAYTIPSPQSSTATNFSPSFTQSPLASPSDITSNPHPDLNDQPSTSTSETVSIIGDYYSSFGQQFN